MKIFLFLLFLNCSLLLKAQDSTQLNNFWNNTEIGLFMGGDERAFTGLQVQTTTAYRLNKKQSLGLTTGLDVHEISVLPLLFHSRRNFLPQQRVNPYIGASAGYGIALARKNSFENTKGGFIGEISSGVQVDRGKQSGFSLALAYRWQHYSIMRRFMTLEETETHRIVRFCFRFGWHF